MTRRIKTRSFDRGKKFAAKEIEEIPPEQQAPVFSLRHIDRGKYCLSACNKNEKAAFADTLYKLSQLTWGQLKVAHRHGCGYETIVRTSIRDGIPAHITDDVNFIAFRFCALAPMVGYRDGVTFHILWLDPGFLLYPH